MGLLLDISPRVLEKVLYFATYIVTDPGDTPLQKNQILTEKEYRDMREKYEDDFEAGMGAEAVQEAAGRDRPGRALRSSCAVSSKDGLRPEEAAHHQAAGGRGGLPHLRQQARVDDHGRRCRSSRRSCVPMVQLDGGRFATSDLNDLYRRVINRNNRLKRLIQLNAPDIIVRNEKRMLQEAVDALIDNGRRGRAGHRRQQPRAQVPVRYAQGQAGPLPPEPAGQARRLLRPFGYRRRPGAEAVSVRPAEGNGHRAVPARS